MSRDGIPNSQTAWNTFADELKRIGEKITGPTGARTERERAEGYRYLIRLLAAAHELEMETDPRRPGLARMMTPIRKFKGDGTDTLYHEAKLDASLEYEFEVTRGDDIFFSITVYAHDENGSYYIVDHLIDDDIAWTERNGRPHAHVQLSAARPDGATNWVRLGESRPVMLLRQYFPEFVHAVDAGRYAQGQFEVRCTKGFEAPDHYTDRELAEGLQRILDFVEDAADVSIGLSIFAGLNMIEYEKTQSGRSVDSTHITEGRMVMDEARSDDYTPEQLAAMIDPKLISNNLPGPGIQYRGAWYKLRDDEAIRITGHDVPCRYWSCQILTRYLESGDYRFHRAGINNRQIKLESDGSFTIWASHENPGVDNWICTQGYTSGHIVMRTLLADPLMEAEFGVVKLTDVPSARP